MEMYDECNYNVVYLSKKRENYDNFFFNFQVVKKHVDEWKMGNGKKKER